jgi:hypothetical protein
MQQPRQLRNKILFYFVLSWFFSSSVWAMTDMEVCLKSETPRKRQVKSVLNLLRDPLAMQAAQIKWPEYCQCSNEKLAELTKDQEQWKAMAYPEQQRLYNLSVQACAKQVGLSPAKPAPPKPVLPADPYYDEREKGCVSAGAGQFLIIESELRSLNDPRIDRSRTLDLGSYCKCYYRYLRENLSAENAKLVASYESHKVQPPEMLLPVNEINSNGIETCVAEQIPFESPKSTATAGDGQPASSFDEIYKSEFVIGKGLGRLQVGISVQQMLGLLGPTNVVSRGGSYDEYRFGPSLTELKVRTAPGGSAGKVIYIAVNYRYRGKISHGLKMGELFETVMAKLKPWEAVSKDRHAGHLLYKEGAQFVFADYNKGTLEGLIAFEPKTHPLLKSKAGK